MNTSKSDRPAILGGRPIRPQGPPDWPRSDLAVRNVLLGMVESGDWGRYHGPHVPELCRRLAEYHGVEHVLACSSGTCAVELALRGVGVGPGDEVILAAYDFKANFQNVLHLGAIPSLIDLDPFTWQLDSEKIESAITSKTRAIVISHLHGGVVAAHQVREIVGQRRIAIVEDACQNPGAVFFGRKSGTWGDVGTLSFGGSKLLTAGRGGAILSSQPEIIERIKRVVLRGNDAYPLSEIQAAIVRPQIDELDALNARRRERVTKLCRELGNDGGLAPIQLQTNEIAPAYYKVGFRYYSDVFGGLSRERFIEAMRAEGIAIDAGFRANHLIHASRRFLAKNALPVATLADSAMLTLHHPVLLLDEEAIDQVVVAVRKIREFAEEIAT